MGVKKLKINYSKRTPGEVIRARREEMKISQMELSFMTKRTVQQIIRIERNQSNPTIDTVSRLEEALGLSLFPIFIDYQKQKNTSHLNLEDIILTIILKHNMTEPELRTMLNNVISEYIKRKQ